MKAFLKGFIIGLCIGGCMLAALFFYYFRIKPDASAPLENIGEETHVIQDAQKSEDIPETEDMPENNEEVPEEADTETTSDAQQPALEETDFKEPKTAVLSFAGDVLFSEQYLTAYDKNGIPAIADADMLSEMQESDLFLLNEEFPFSLRGEAMADKQFTFRTDPKYVKIFQDLGADIVTVANNHALDFGRDAFLDTLDTLKQADITCIGGGYNLAEASAPAIKTVGGQTFAIFGATRVSPSYNWYATDSQAGLFQTYDPAKLNAGIAEARELYDHVIVFVHWGVEKAELPEDYQRQLAKGYIDAGADLIVGCHPHVLQGFEYYNGVPIIYSLGNYLFGNRTGETLLLKASFSPGEPLSIRLIPCQRVNGVLSRIQNPAALYQHLTDLSFGAGVSEEGILTVKDF